MHPHKWPGFSMSPVHLRPEGRGLVSLANRDPFAPPRIEFKFMETAHDVDAMIRGVRLARKLAEQPALKLYIAEEVVPGPAVRSDEQLIEDIRNRGVSNLHPVGTCRMGHGSRRGRGSPVCGYMVFEGCALPMPPSCLWLSAATPMLLRS